jgi:hypothetical protein
MRFRLNNQEFFIATVSDLQQHLEPVRRQQFSEVWLTVNDDGPALAMLVNGTRAWLMYLCHQDGDPGLSSRNAHYSGPAEAMMEFLLRNGHRMNIQLLGPFLLRKLLVLASISFSTREAGHLLSSGTMIQVRKKNKIHLSC